ncbi:MAG: response regulator transcription factor [Ferruginibacter sp.]|nr:response regulator transcription factor [Cytophagales bacterium]
MTRLLIADDHQLFIDGLSSLLSHEPTIEIIGQASNGQEVLQTLAEQPTDILLLDINMPNTDVVKLTREIRARFPLTKIIILTMYHGTRYYTKLLQHGINGYLYKSEGKAEFLEAIEKASRGEMFISKELFAGLPGTKTAPSPAFDVKLSTPESLLTRREIEVLKLIAQEHTNHAIADQLSISTGTVDTHRKNILLKLGVKNTVGLIKYCLRNNLLE